MTVWFNGSFIPADQPVLQASDRALLGDGVFDTMLAADGKPARGLRHMERLLRHARMIDIQSPCSPEQLLDVARGLLDRLGFFSGRHIVKTVITMGPGARGLALPDEMRPSLIMTATPAPDPGALPPASAIFSQNIRRNEHSLTSRIKSINYTDNRIARQEAQQRGASEAFLLNTAGCIACAATGNIFVLKNGRLVTPPLTDGVMDGIIRAAIIENADVEERSLLPEDLSGCEGIYTTNSVTGVRLVVELEGKKVDSIPLEVANLFPFF